MKIIVGKTAGFCYGVKRAVEGAEEELEKTTEHIACLGEIVHNKEVIMSLEKKGIDFIEHLEEAKGKVIIRAHGIPQEIEKEAEKLNVKLIDYTCPNVLRIHQIAEEYAQKGFYIFLLGTPNHPENIGTMSYCGNYYQVIEKEEELQEAIEKYLASNVKKLLVIEQTTYSLERFKKIEEKIKEQIPNNIELIIKNTICAATRQRQEETEKLAQKVDSMIIIGGSNSSNTKKLYEIAKQNCKHTISIETKKEVDLEEFQDCEVIGIMAGASTPQESIDEVIRKLKQAEEIFA